MKLTTKNIENYMKKNHDVEIYIGKASDWAGSLSHAQRWADGSSIKRYRAFSTFSKGYNAIIPPIKSFENLKALWEYLRDQYNF